jgi:hypothetical protein
VRGAGPSAHEATSSIRVDDTHWPLVLSSFLGTPTSDEVDAWLIQMSAVYARDGRFVLLADIAPARPDLGHVQRIGAWSKKHRDLTRAKCAGVAVVLRSPALRFVISAFYLVVTLPCPMVVFDDEPPAAVWLRRQLELDGLPVPPYLQSPERRVSGS